MENNARIVAFRALERCEKDHAWSAVTLDSLLRETELPARDAALATRMFLGVLQNETYLDHYLDLFCRTRTEPALRAVLRLGAYQLLFLDKIPAHAAVSETVELCRSVRLDRGASLVNAVLRRLSENKDRLPPIPGEGSASFLAIRYSHPLWLAERLMREQGYHQTEAFFRANNETAPLCIQLNRLRVSTADYLRSLDRLGISYRIFPELPGCLELDGGKVTALPGFEEGLFYVQDRAARIAVHAAGVMPGMRILDACAAPGGKSMAAVLDARGDCRLIGCDLHEKKLRLILSSAKRLGLEDCLDTLAADARSFRPEWESSFDVVLADVPCSGLGVIRKRPEIRRKGEEELQALPQIQGAILDNLCRYVKPGGVLLYSTCTVLQAENRDQLSSFLQKHPDFSAEDFSVGGIHSADGCYSFWPQIDGTDGFFAAKLRRKTL